MMGVKKTTDFLEKATWTLGSVLLVLSILSAVVTGSGKVEETQGSELDEKLENVVTSLVDPSATSANLATEQVKS